MHILILLIINQGNIAKNDVDRGSFGEQAENWYITSLGHEYA